MKRINLLYLIVLCGIGLDLRSAERPDDRGLPADGILLPKIESIAEVDMDSSANLQDLVFNHPEVYPLFRFLEGWDTTGFKKDLFEIPENGFTAKNFKLLLGYLANPSMQCSEDQQIAILQLADFLIWQIF